MLAERIGAMSALPCHLLDIIEGGWSRDRESHIHWKTSMAEKEATEP
jgi:hypothetical protein